MSADVGHAGARVGPATARSGEDWTAVRRHPAEIRRADAVGVLGACGLLGCLFALRWFGAVAPARGLVPTGRLLALGAWGELAVVSWLLVAAAALALVRALLGRRGRQALAVPALALSAAAAGALAYRVLLDPPQAGRIVDVKLGGYLGLLCAVALAVGAAAGWRHTRDRQPETRNRTHTFRRRGR